MTDMCCTMQRILTQNDMKFISKKMSPHDFMCSPSLRVWQVSLLVVIDFRLSCHMAHHAFNPAVVSTIRPDQTNLLLHILHSVIFLMKLITVLQSQI